jgi:DNA uptake protein ComE-like DNA-binding protein
MAWTRSSIRWVRRVSSKLTRRGFTMLTVLWVLGGAGTVVAVSMIAGRNGLGAARNRVEWQRARWRALGCARRAQSAIGAELGGARTPERGASVWQALNVAIDSSPTIAGCTVTLEAAGAKLDVNGASVEQLERFFAAVQLPEDVPQLAADVAAARDSTPFADVKDLRRARSTVAWSDYDSLLSVEPGRVALSAAPSVVLQSIPGFTPEIAGAVVTNRVSHGPVSELNEVAGLVSRASATELEERFQDAVRVATANPDAWILRSVAYSGVPRIGATVEWRMTRQGNHVLIVRSSVQ